MSYSVNHKHALHKSYTRINANTQFERNIKIKIKVKWITEISIICESKLEYSQGTSTKIRSIRSQNK